MVRDMLGEPTEKESWSGSGRPLGAGVPQLKRLPYDPFTSQQRTIAMAQAGQNNSASQPTSLDPFLPSFLKQSRPLKTKAPASPVKAPGQNKRLSFSEDAEDEEDGSSTISFSLAESTRKRFQTESKHVSALDPPKSPIPTVKSRKQASLGPIICGAAQARGARPYMEDRQTFISSYTPLSFTSQPLPDDIFRTFAAVYDGHNGAMAADHASSRLHMLLAQDPAIRWTASGPGTVQSSFIHSEAETREAKACTEVENAIKTAFFAIDGEILEKSRQDDARDGSAALMVLRMGSMLWTAHAGDSRAVLCRDGKAVRLTEDHKPELEREKARVEANGGHVDFQHRCCRVICPADKDRKASGLAMSRSLGDLNFKEPRRFIECEPDVSRLRASEQDSFMILASDGLWDVMADHDAVTVVKEKMAANAARGHTKAALDFRTKEAAQLLVDTALNKGSMDNITVLILHFQWFQ